MKKFSSYLIPSLIASVLMSMYAVIDGIFIGQKIGDAGLSAINISWPITAFLQAIGTALGMAGGICSQHYIALRDEAKANKMKLTAILLVVVLGIVLGLALYLVKSPLLQFLGTTEESYEYALGYTKIILIGSLFQMLGMAFIPLLKNSKLVKTAMAASLVSMGVNLVLDYLLIFQLDYGLEGAAWGSVIAQISSCLVCLIAFMIKVKPGKKIDIKNIPELLKTALAPFILSYSYSIIILMTNLVCMHYGQDEAVAAYTLLSYLSYINIAIACAVGDSIQPLFSYNHELKAYRKNKKMLLDSLMISVLCCLILAILMYTLKKPLGDLYNLSPTAYQYYEDGILYYSLATCFIAIIKVFASYFYSIRQKVQANLLVLLEPFVLTPLFLYLFSLKLELYGVWVSYLVVQAVLLVLAVVLMVTIKNKFQNVSSY